MFMPQHRHVRSIGLPDAGSGQDGDPSNETVVAHAWQSTVREENQLKWPSRKIYVTDEPSLACPTILTETHTFDLSERYLMLDACSSQLELFIMFGFSWFRRCLKVKCGLGASLPHLKQSNCLALIII